jgi:hypothetical protein
MEEHAIPQTPIPTEKKPHGNKGRKVNEKQMEGLRKGMEALKLKRELAKEKKAKKLAGGEVSSEDEGPPPEKPITREKLLEAIPLKPARTRRSPVKKETSQQYASKNDFESFKTQVIESIKTTPKEVVVEKEVVREVPVERVVEKKLTGSAMLDAIFKFN